MSSTFKRSTLSLRLRVVLSIILLLVIIVGTFSFLTVRSIHGLIEKVMWENYSAYAKSFAAFSAKSFAERDLQELQRHLEIAFAQPDVIFVVASDPTGAVVGHAGDIEVGDHAEVHRAIFADGNVKVEEIGHKPSGLFHSSGHTFLITSHIRFNGKDVGSIKMAVNTASANQRLEAISLWGFKMALSIVVLSTLILIFVDRKLKKNIERLIQITRSMAMGDLSQRVEIRTGDEIEHLGESFNLMAEAIREREEEILTTRKKYENLFEESVIPTFVLDAEGQILAVNKAGEMLLGFPREQLLKKSMTDLAAHPEQMRQVLNQVIEKGEYVRGIEHQIKHRNGATIIVENNAGPLLDENGTLLSVISTFKDITQQKHLERKLQEYTEQLEKQVENRTRELEEEKNKLQLILDNVPSAFLMSDRELRVESVSAQFESVLGKKRQEVLGKTCALTDLLYESKDDCPVQSALESGKVQVREAHVLAPSGEDRYLEHTAIPIRRQGEIEKVLEIVTDVTARKRFEEQLIRTEKLSATGEMAAIIAHEMRNGLSTVNLILQHLSDALGQEGGDTKSVGVAMESVNRMEQIVSQLLQFAKPGEIRFEPADLNDLIRQSLAFCDFQFRRKNIQVQLDLGKNLAVMHVDTERMREMLINLLLNACEAVEVGGTVSVESRCLMLERPMVDQFDRKAVALRKGQAVVRVRIRDDGPGIPRENLRRIFDPFYTTKTHGTGLGLTMAKRAVGEHGGIMTVDSKVGEGSLFSIVLPINACAEK